MIYGSEVVIDSIRAVGGEVGMSVAGVGYKVDRRYNYWDHSNR